MRIMQFLKESHPLRRAEAEYLLIMPLYGFKHPDFIPGIPIISLFCKIAKAAVEMFKLIFIEK